MKNDVLFKAKLLEPTFGNSSGEVVNVKFVDENGNIYYYDGLSRWVFLKPEDRWEKLEEGES
jgi:hypothetical protein